MEGLPKIFSGSNKFVPTQIFQVISDTRSEPNTGSITNPGTAKYSDIKWWSRYDCIEQQRVLFGDLLPG